MKKTIGTLLLCAAATTVNAYDAGDWILRAGPANVNPNEDSSALTLNGVELSQLGLGLPRTEASVDSNTQLGITATYMLSPSWGIELLASTPFTHEIRADALGVDAGEIKHLPPTLSAQYYFNGGDNAFQPFVGVGVNYTLFFDEESDAELNAALEGLGATGDADLSLDNSLGLSLEAGFDYVTENNWLFNVTLWYIDLCTEATFDTPGLGDIKADVDIDPLVVMGSVGFVF